MVNDKAIVKKYKGLSESLRVEMTKCAVKGLNFPHYKTNRNIMIFKRLSNGINLFSDKRVSKKAEKRFKRNG